MMTALRIFVWASFLWMVIDDGYRVYSSHAWRDIRSLAIGVIAFMVLSYLWWREVYNKAHPEI
jgi:hypothetical protein